MRGAWLVMMLFVCVTEVRAQTSAALSGAVSHSQRPIEGVRITVSSPALQGERSAVTGAEGTYHFPALPPGRYDVMFEKSGVPSVRSVIVLRLAQASRVNVELPELGVSEVIDVRASGPAIESPEVSTSLPLALVERLPLQRNQLATAQLAPGVTGNTLSNGQLQISGGPGYDNLVLVNGVVVTENTRGQMRPMYVEDAIQETTLLTAAISAEYGRFSGGVVNTITRSGGNELTASLRDSLSSPAWSAATPAGEERESTLNHVWEATAGGYLLRDRLWFFTAGRWARNDTARQTAAVPGSGVPGISYAEENDQKRWELKLTAQPGARHNLTASAFRIDTEGVNVRAGGNVYDRASLTTRDDPESLLAVRYDALAGANLLIEAQYSAREFASTTGAPLTDLIGGTLLLDRSNNNTRFNAPSLCGVCDPERRDNTDILLKAHALLGRHELVAGIDRFTERRLANDHQSGSGFSLFVTRVAMRDGVLYPVVTPTTQNGGGTFIRWNPVLVAARENELRTDSAFVNDIWSIGNRWQLSLGARWDRNHAVDSDGVVAADDARLTPRLSAQYDLAGDGRHRLSVSFAEYASRVSDSIASSNQAAGRAAEIDFAYRGPALNDRELTMSLEDVVASVFHTFNNVQGGTDNRAPSNLRNNGARSVPGYSTYFDGTLASPYVREVSVGYGAQLGRAGYVRADVIRRDWRDSYATSVTTETRRADTPLGIPVDLALIRNSNDLERQYRALQLQARWTPSRFDTGLHYTLASLRGNSDGESATSGAVANIDPALFYPEYFAYRDAVPIGYLQGDQRHRLRAWIGYEPWPALSISILQNFDSGRAYSMVGPINLTRYDGAPDNPGYNNVPNALYYFSGRGALRTDAIHSTDLAVRTRVHVGLIELFAQADLLNTFNRHGIADPQRLGLTVATAATSPTLQPFNPATEIPILGTHYRPAPNFGQPLNDLAYQNPRTFRVSLGARF